MSGQYGSVGVTRVVAHRHRAAAQPFGRCIGVGFVMEPPHIEAGIPLAPNIIGIPDTKQVALQYGTRILLDLGEVDSSRDWQPGRHGSAPSNVNTQDQQYGQYDNGRPKPLK